MKRNPIILAALYLAILAVAACGPQMQTAPPGGYVYGNYGPGPGGFYGTARRRTIRTARVRAETTKPRRQDRYAEGPAGYSPGGAFVLRSLKRLLSRNCGIIS